MRKIENWCVDCGSQGLHCHGTACSNRNVFVMACDECEDTVETLYDFDDRELCESCVEDLTRLEESIAFGTKCDKCGITGDEYELYDFMGEILCDGCFHEALRDYELTDMPDDAEDFAS